MTNLLADKDLARSLVESLPISAGLWYVHPFSCFLNNGVTELTGYSNGDFQKGRFFWLHHVHPRDRARISGVWKELQRTATKISCEYRFLPKGKREVIWIKDISHSFELSDGKIGGIVSVYSDINPETEDVPKTDGEVPRIIRGLVHDLRSHVHTINGAVELARMTGPSNLRSEDITKATKEINKLVDEFKDYFIPSVPQVSPVRVESIMEDVAMRAEDQIQGRGIRVELLHHGDLPYLWLDAKEVTKAIERLVEFSGNMLLEGGELRIETKKVAGNREDSIEIRITGRSSCPLAIDEKEVFRPFPELQQFKAGLGIALARETLLRNHGRVFFQQFDPQLVVLVVSFSIGQIDASGR